MKKKSKDSAFLLLADEVTRLNSDVTRLDHEVHVWKAKSSRYRRVLERFGKWPTKTMWQSPEKLIVKIRQIAKSALQDEALH